MHNNLPIFKKIQITKKNGSYLSHSESSLLISGDYLIIITINDDLNYVEHNDDYDIKIYKKSKEL